MNRNTRVVVDPSVLVSVLISSQGYPARILDAAEERRFELVVSEKLPAELEEVHMRPRLRRFFPEEVGRHTCVGCAASPSSATILRPPRDTPMTSRMTISWLSRTPISPATSSPATVTCWSRRESCRPGAQAHKLRRGAGEAVGR